MPTISAPRSRPLADTAPPAMDASTPISPYAPHSPTSARCQKLMLASDETATIQKSNSARVDDET